MPSVSRLDESEADQGTVQHSRTPRDRGTPDAPIGEIHQQSMSYRRRRRRIFRRSRRLVGHGKDLTVPQEHPLHLGAVEWACPAATEDRQLIPAFIDGTIAVDSF